MSQPIHNIQLNGPQGPGGIQPGPGEAARSSPLDPAREGEFAELLAKLRAQTEALEEEAREPQGEGGDLKDSVKRAGDSFKEAMEIGERLIEAYRRSNL